MVSNKGKARKKAEVLFCTGCEHLPKGCKVSIGGVGLGCPKYYQFQKALDILEGEG